MPRKKRPVLTPEKKSLSLPQKGEYPANDLAVRLRQRKIIPDCQVADVRLILEPSNFYQKNQVTKYIPYFRIQDVWQKRHELRIAIRIRRGGNRYPNVLCSLGTCLIEHRGRRRVFFESRIEVASSTLFKINDRYYKRKNTKIIRVKEDNKTAVEHLCLVPVLDQENIPIPRISRKPNNGTLLKTFSNLRTSWDIERVRFEISQYKSDAEFYLAFQIKKHGLLLLWKQPKTEQRWALS